MPWLTPDSIPEDGTCRPLSIPADSAWLALVSGALTELTKPYNWEKFGALTVDETVAEMQSIIDSYYNVPCQTCLTPGGYRVVRISPEGHLQQLSASGEWEDATDDYLIPLPAARTDGTETDQNCLAAKNATNVLHTLYTSLSDSFASHLSEAEALTAFTTALIGAVGFEFAPITAGVAAFFFVLFEALYTALAYLTADLWTDTFTEAFTCLLLSCVNNDAGVVTFDWACIQAALLAQVDNFGLSEVQIRLYLQISYILYFIGGVDGLNLAARTTDITDDDCSICGIQSFMWDFRLSLYDWEIPISSGALPFGEWVSGAGIESRNLGSGFSNYAVVKRDFTGFNLVRVVAIVQVADCGSTGLVGFYNDGVALAVGGCTVGTNEPTWDGNESIGVLQLNADGDPPYSSTIVKICVFFTGTNPFGDNPCDI